MNEEKKENYIEFYIKKIGQKEPRITEVEVADSGIYYRIRIFTKDNPTFEIDQIN